MYGSVQDISDKEVGKVLEQRTSFRLADDTLAPKEVKELLTARDKEFSILERLADTGVTPKPGKKNLFGFTMEKVEGDTLHDFLSKTLQDPSDEQLEALGKSVGDAIGKVHSKGVIHADLHTNNIFIDKKGQVKIVDFGESVLVDKDKLNDYFEQDLSKVVNNISTFLQGEYRDREAYIAARKRAEIFEKSLREAYNRS